MTGRTRWNRCRNVDILRLETAENYKLLFDNWNMRTSSQLPSTWPLKRRRIAELTFILRRASTVWLRECVYKRVTPKGKKPGFQSTMITFCASAFWVRRLCVHSRLSDRAEVRSSDTLTARHSAWLLL